MIIELTFVQIRLKKPKILVKKLTFLKIIYIHFFLKILRCLKVRKILKKIQLSIFCHKFIKCRPRVIKLKFNGKLVKSI